MNRQTQVLIALLAVIATPLVYAADKPANTVNPDAACVGCHGPGGNKPITPQTPRLGGQNYDYLVEALTQYRNGVRQDPVMGAMAKALSDEQMRALARYFSTQSGLTVKY